MTNIDDQDETGTTPTQSAPGTGDAGTDLPKAVEPVAAAADPAMVASAAFGQQPAAVDAFDEPVVKAPDDNGDLVLDLDGYEGPIDVLLTLARDQKVDLKKISILELADQYLAFVARARRLRLELAADYLVMAAWLAYLKSRLLLPEPEGEAEPTGAELAAALAFQLQRLDAMQRAGVQRIALARPSPGAFVRAPP